MEIIRIPRIVQDTCRKYSLQGRTIGFVPTMGALHEGHLSLIKRARDENHITVVSIFVNPLQFGPSEDLEQYPRDIENDVLKIRNLGSDILFLPEIKAMYPEGFSTSVEVGPLSERLCGRFRPGHFRGVSTVVAKLLIITRPTRAYFGQKDFQQTVIIKRMAKDLLIDTDIVVCPTIREQDGLALSSRNAYLNAEQRKAASALFRSLHAAAESIASGTRSASEITHIMNKVLSEEVLISQVEYASIYNPETLDKAEELRGEALLAVAVRLGETRLIDNMLVDVP